MWWICHINANLPEGNISFAVSHAWGFTNGCCQHPKPLWLEIYPPGLCFSSFSEASTVAPLRLGLSQRDDEKPVAACEKLRWVRPLVPVLGHQEILQDMNPTWSVRNLGIPWNEAFQDILESSILWEVLVTSFHPVSTQWFWAIAESNAFINGWLVSFPKTIWKSGAVSDGFPVLFSLSEKDSFEPTPPATGPNKPWREAGVRELGMRDSYDPTAGPKTRQIGW